MGIKRTVIVISRNPPGKKRWAASLCSERIICFDLLKNENETTMSIVFLKKTIVFRDLISIFNTVRKVYECSVTCVFLIEGNFLNIFRPKVYFINKERVVVNDH